MGFPARSGKPKDKSHVENAVKLTYKDIFTSLEGLHCPDVASLNIAIRSALERHNNKNPDRRNYSRREYFEDVERDALRPLNPIRFQIKKHLTATVDKYGYIRLKEDIHFYSVPHIYIGKKLNISYTSADVEVWDPRTYTKVAHHTRDRHEFRRTTDAEHLCPKHRAIAEWSPEKFISQAAAIHEDVEHYIRRILEKTSYGDQANKYCSGILNKVTSLRFVRTA